MNSPFFTQMLDALDQGIIIINLEGEVVFFNHWMELASNISLTQAVGKKLTGIFPQIDTPLFQRNLKSVITFGNTAFFSHGTHPWLIPLPPSPGSSHGFESMQQSGQMGPLREGNTIKYIYIIISDITDAVNDVQYLTRMAMHDPLTGAWNRRWFDHWLCEEINRAERYGRLLSLIMLDLDLFKTVNDTYGHPAGDTVLKEVTNQCMSIIRTTDTLSRFGGEEFCVLMPETSSEAACALAERLRSGIEKLEIVHEDSKINITVSLGVSVFSPGMGAEALLHHADASLYHAKRNGRNRVEYIVDL